MNTVYEKLQGIPDRRCFFSGETIGGRYYYRSFSRRDQDAKDYATIGEKSGDTR